MSPIQSPAAGAVLGATGVGNAAQTDWAADPTSNPTATLISCYPYQVDNQRYVVFAELLDG